METFSSFAENHECVTFSRSHSSHFVSDFSKNPKPMSKRGQEQNVGEGSAVAKPKPMSPVLERARIQVAQVSSASSLWDTRNDSDTSLHNPESPGRAVTAQAGVSQSFRRRVSNCGDTADNVELPQVKTQEFEQNLKMAPKSVPTSGRFKMTSFTPKVCSLSH